MRLLVLLVALAGCDKVLGLGHLADAPPIDPDASRFLDAPPPGTVCAGTLDHVCKQEADLGEMTITNLTVDTDAAACQYMTMDPIPVQVCVIAASKLTVSGALRATGTHPLVLFSSDTIVVTSTASIDVSSSIGNLGAGANFPDCVSEYSLAGPAQSTSVNSGGGGAGGSFNGKGGDGGSNGNAATAAVVSPTTNLKFIRGGCPGGDGGYDLNDAHAGLSGPSGGAVYLMAAGPIDIAGKIYANGGGGGGGTAGPSSDFAGGGGGGTGGAIVIDGKQVDILPTAVVIAGGGGGGAGEDGTMAGGNGTSANASAGGAGGTVPTGSAAGPGGAGGFTHTAQAGVIHAGSQGGSGGGGGATGFIRLFPSTPPQGFVVPAPS